MNAEGGAMMTLTPAYGRDYKSQKDVKAAWDAGKDFVVNTFGPDNGRYINKEDAERFAKGQTLNIRYSKNTKVCVIRV